MENQNGTFTLTDKHGIETHFNSSGLIASREDRSGNTIEYSRNSDGTIDEITDADGFVTDYEYNSRSWLTKITYPDPDGAGSVGRAESTYSHDGAGHVSYLGVAIPSSL